MRNLFLMLSVLFAPYFANASEDLWSNERSAVWRSTRITIGLNFVPIATGAIHMHEVKIESPTWNNSSWVSIFNSTRPQTGTEVTTAAFVNTNTTTHQISSGGAIVPATASNIYDLYLSSGLVVNKIGAAVVNILWDFIYHRNEQESRLSPYNP